MGCKAQTAAIAAAIARICNAANRPRPRMPATQEVMQGLLDEAPLKIVYISARLHTSERENRMATYQELLKQQAALSVQIEEARKREIADAVNRARQIVAEYGLTEKDVFPAGRRSPVTRATSKVAPKYRDPATGQTWTGRGKPPKWIEGRDRLGFLIA